MNEILRGTTPDFVIHIDPDDFAVTDVVKLEVTIWNGPLVTVYDLDSVTADSEENNFGIHFTEAQTLAFDAARPFRWQMRCMFADGNIAGTLQSPPIDVAPLKSEDVMTE